MVVTRLGAVLPYHRAPMRYDLLAIDLDGTLLDSRGRVSRANLKALDRARKAGLEVTLCTGRGTRETLATAVAVGQRTPIVTAGGAIIADAGDGRTIHRFSLRQDLLHPATDLLLSHGYAVLVLKDATETGYDYLVVRGEQNHPVGQCNEWWFNHTGVSVRYAQRLDEDEHPEHTVRFGVAGMSADFAPIKAGLTDRFAGRFAIQHFQGVFDPDHVGLPVGATYDVIEMCDSGVNKWSALEHLASSHGIDTGRIAAIGDQVNDIEMVKGAALGVAMANARPEVRAVADRSTLSNEEDGVAHAIDRILAGEW